MTRVSPIEISADPVAVRTKPGSIVVGPQLVAPTARSCAAFTPPPAQPQLDVDDLAERHLQEPRPQRVEGLHVRGAAEAIAALALPGVQSPPGRQRPLDAPGYACA